MQAAAPFLRVRTALFLVVLVTSATACISADGPVFVAQDGGEANGADATPAPLPCAAPLFRVSALSQGYDYWGGAMARGQRPLVVTNTDGRYVVNELEIGATSSTVKSVTTLGGAGFMTAPALLASAADRLTVVFGNFTLGGRWDIFTADWVPLTEGTSPPYQAVSSGGTENIGSKAAWANGRLGIAYRQDRRPAFAVVENGRVIRQFIGEEALPHPQFLRVVARVGGFSSLYVRANAFMAHSDLSGASMGEVAFPSRYVDMMAAPGATMPVVFAADASGLSRFVFNNLTTLPSAQSLGISVGAVVNLRVQAVGANVAVAWQESGQDSRLRVAWVTSSGVRETAPLPMPVGEPSALELVLVDGGVLALYETAGALFGRVYCAP